MQVTVIGCALFLIPFSIQILLWRTTKIATTPRNIVFIFLGIQMFCIAIFKLGTYFSLWQNCTPAQLAHAFLFSSAILVAYLLSYPLIETDSPSNTILLNIESAGQAGLSRSQLAKVLPNEAFVLIRLRGLVRDKKLSYSKRRYDLTQEGKRFLEFFRLLRLLFTNKPFGG